MPKSVSVRSGQVEFLKLNLEKREWRDAYQWLLALSWPQFAALIAGVYIVINLIFAEFYALGGESIAGITCKLSPLSVMATGIRKLFTAMSSRPSKSSLACSDSPS